MGQKCLKPLLYGPAIEAMLTQMIGPRLGTGAGELIHALGRPVIDHHGRDFGMKL
jgi:hypothetical protein